MAGIRVPLKAIAPTSDLATAALGGIESAWQAQPENAGRRLEEECNCPSAQDAEVQQKLRAQLAELRAENDKLRLQLVSLSRDPSTDFSDTYRLPRQEQLKVI